MVASDKQQSGTSVIYSSNLSHRARPSAHIERRTQFIHSLYTGHAPNDTQLNATLNGGHSAEHTRSKSYSFAHSALPCHQKDEPITA